MCSTSRSILLCLALLCGACPAGRRAGVAPPRPLPRAGGDVAATPQQAPPAPVARDVLLSVVLPRVEHDLSWLSKRLQAPLPAGPLRRFFGAAGLRRALLALLRQGHVSAHLDLRRPVALALVDRPGSKLRWSEQTIVTVGLKDGPGFLAALASRYGEGREEAGVHRFGSLGPVLRIVGGRAYLAASVEVLAGAEAVLSPLLKTAGAGVGELVLWSSRIRRRFGPSVDAALRWIGRRRASLALLPLHALRRRAWDLARAVWRGRVARLTLRFQAERITLLGRVEGGKERARGGAQAAAPLWGAELLGDAASGAFFIARQGPWAEAPLRWAVGLLPVGRRATIDKRLRALGAHLNGPALGAAYGTKAGSMGMVWLCRVDDVAGARRALRALRAALPAAFTQAWPGLQRRYLVARGLRRRPRLARRPLSLLEGKGSLLTVKLAWRDRLQGEVAGWREAWDAWWGRSGPELALGVVNDGGGPFFALAVGPGAGAKLREVARRAKRRTKRGRFADRWSARLGGRPVDAACRVSLTRLAEQSLSLMARRQKGPAPWGALLRQILPPVGADRPAAVTAWVGAEGKGLRFAVEFSSDMVGWATKVGLLLFRVGSYGSRAGKGRPITP